MSRLSAPARRALRRAYFEALRTARLDRRRLGRHRASNHALILQLHRVSPDSNPYWPALDPEMFRELLIWLRRWTTVTLLRELRDCAATNSRRPFVVLSFDDGYKDFAECVHPILDELGLRANLNVIGHSIESGERPPSVRFSDMLETAPLDQLRPLRLGDLTLRLASDDPLDKERFGATANRYVKSLDADERSRVLADLERRWGIADSQRHTEMMREAEVVAMARAGHEIGIHSYAHESMAPLTDGLFLRDVERCMGLIERLGLSTSVYAFPNGSYRPRQVELLAEAGFECILLVDERPTRPDRNLHPRLIVRGHSLSELVCRSVGWGTPRFPFR